MESVEFRRNYQYKTSSLGIEIPISIIASSGKEVSLLAKVDTGAKFCVFQREYGEQLGFEIEAGLPQSFSTATGRFDAYGHSVKLSYLDFDTDSIVFFAGAGRGGGGKRRKTGGGEFAL